MQHPCRFVQKEICGIKLLSYHPAIVLQGGMVGSLGSLDSTAIFHHFCLHRALKFDELLRWSYGDLSLLQVHSSRNILMRVATGYPLSWQKLWSLLGTLLHTMPYMLLTRKAGTHISCHPEKVGAQVGVKYNHPSCKGTWI